MKKLVRIVFVCIVAAIATGYFFKISLKDHLTGDRIIGVAVLALAFVLMPLFLVYRYRKTNIRNYMFSRNEGEDGKETPGNR